MDTLSNVTFHGEEAASPSVGVTSVRLPEAVSMQTGVSVEYVPTADKQWYVLRTKFGREGLAADYLIEQGVYVYVARQRTKDRDKDGNLRNTIKCLTPNLLFAYLTPQEAQQYVKDTAALTYLTFYYNHFVVGIDYKNPPLTIPQHQMINFIRATSTQSEHIMVVDPERVRLLRDGAMVKVVDGDYAGVEGRVARVAGQQRIIVSLPNGLITIATAYIPTAFLREM